MNQSEYFITQSLQGANEPYGLVDDLEAVPGKIWDGIKTAKNSIVEVGGTIIDGIENAGSIGYNKAKSFASTVGSKLKDLGEGGIDFAGDVKDKIVEGASFMKEKGIPFIKGLGPTFMNLLRMSFWIVILIGLVILFKILNMGAGVVPGIKKGLPTPIVFAIMGIITFGLAIGIKKIYSITKKLG